MAGTLLTLDLGTTYFKAALVDGDGRIVALDRVAPPIEHPRSDRWELPVIGFERSIREAIGRLGQQVPEGLKAVEAITFSTQTNSFVLLDARDRPLTPLILWPDGRAADLAEEVKALASPQELKLFTGLPATSPQLLPAKLLWLGRHEPRLYARARRLCLISDYLSLWFSGLHVTEAGAMAFTSLVDISRLAWWEQMLQRTGLPQTWLPEIVRAGTELGPIRAKVADELGLPRTCRVVAGAFDQHAGAVGVGNIAPGAASETTGTVLVCVRSVDRPRPDAPDTIYQGPGYAPGLFYQLAVSETSANLLEWYRNTLSDRPGFEVLGDLAAHATAAPELRLSGNARPTSLDDLFVGRQPEHSRGQLVRCIMEGVADALADQVAQLWPYTRPGTIRSAGGGARSDVWLQIKADRVGHHLAATACAEPTSLGAAMLAADALGWLSLAESARRWVVVRRTFHPALR